MKDLLFALDELCDIIDGPENLDSAGDTPGPTLVSALKKYRKNFIKPLATTIGYSYDEGEGFTHQVDTSAISSKRVFIGV